MTKPKFAPCGSCGWSEPHKECDPRPISEIFAHEISKKDFEIAQLKKYNTEAGEALARAIATIGFLALRIKNIRQASPKKYSCVICHQPITGDMIGAGEGDGDIFAHLECYGPRS